VNITFIWTEIFPFRLSERGGGVRKSCYYKQLQLWWKSCEMLTYNLWESVKMLIFKLQSHKLRIWQGWCWLSISLCACLRARVCKYVLLVDTCITPLLQTSCSPYLYLLVSSGTKSCALLGYMFDQDYLAYEESVCEDVMMILITETDLIRQWMTQCFLIHFVISPSSTVTNQALIDLFLSVSTNSLFAELPIRLSIFGL
jgi:hypothetical protein